MIKDLVLAKLKEIVELQDIIKKDDLNYKSKGRRTYYFSKYLVPIGFIGDVHEVHLLIKGADISKVILLIN